MTHRILEQCNTANFRNIKNIVGLSSTDQLPKLSSGDMLAAVLARAMVQAGFTFDELLMIRQVLHWDNGLEFKMKPADASCPVLDKINKLMPQINKAIGEILDRLNKTEDHHADH